MSVTVAVCQTNPEKGRVEENLERALALMTPTKADLFVLPELAFTGYNFDDIGQVRAGATSPSDGVDFRVLGEFARRRKVWVAWGFVERAVDGFYNSAALVGPEGVVGLYRKTHLFFRETLFFRPGDTGFPVWSLPWGRVGMMICFDWFFPEAMRTLALKGAQIVVHPSNLVLPYCPAAMVTRCLENRVFAATANRIGTEPGGERPLTFIGQSEIVSPRGEILARLERIETVGTAEIELAEADDKQLNPYNDLFAARRPEHYLRH